MDNKLSTPDFELSPDLIRQFKQALTSVDDIRLVVLLLFNAFEVIMESFLAWRLGCGRSDLPRFLTSSSRNLFEITLAGKAGKKLLGDIEVFCKLRNEVAHNFHLQDYKPEIAKFLHRISGEPCPEPDAAQRQAMINAVFALTLNIAAYYDDIPQRGQWPFPILSLELASSG